MDEAKGEEKKESKVSMIQTTPSQQIDGTVLIVMKDGRIQEVISDLQLNVQVSHVGKAGVSSYPSRPLWEYLRKAAALLLTGD